MSIKARIEAKLADALAPEQLDVIDESHLHAGHAGHRPGGETHFRVNIVSTTFAGQSRLERHRTVNRILAEELAGGVHALAVHPSAPGEEARPAGRPS
ncbi:transcriptional regulator, BolA protein family [Faunimonas pinastri]|uniref:Transcriptional regulator, BolA protein family n=1 Tax=Faunimonas pinastri TaxID=1855383 RepID=A0A1H9C7H5_9HYPH|nr:BolA family protein [Faunimonas pinastri]SEP97156.1 transcriptional regulator, BolA protein family [Faunimonas pinastri]